jgi:hypothetical protein
MQQRRGGLECNFQARLASSELGWLRDVRFVFPALCAKEVETRLAAVACLAFLWSEEGNKYLRRMAVEDVEPGVRQSALWAYGFANGIDAAELVSWRKGMILMFTFAHLLKRRLCFATKAGGRCSIKL